MTSPADQGQSLSAEQRGCIAACAGCREACEQTASLLVSSGDETEYGPLVALLRECAAQCDRTAEAVRAGGAACGEAIAAVREIAGRTMKELIEHSDGEEPVEACIEACRRCATSCMEAEGAAVPYDKVAADSFPGSDPPPH